MGCVQLHSLSVGSYVNDLQVSDMKRIALRYTVSNIIFDGTELLMYPMLAHEDKILESTPNPGRLKYQ